MIINRSQIYGIEVFEFQSCNGTPYQLTIEPNLKGTKHVVSLVNLIGNEVNIYCNDFRKNICKVLFTYLKRINSTLYFDISLIEKRSYTLLFKFFRWMEAYKDVIDVTTDLTLIDDNYYAEVNITLIEDYINNTEVK